MAAYTPSLQRNLGFLNTLQLVKAHSLVDTVQQVWREIVTEWFPGRDGYKWGFKGAILADNLQPDVTVIDVNALSPGPDGSNEWTERLILLIECKRPSGDTSNDWSDTINGQFEDDLSQNLNLSEKLFGAVAIGKKVRFYRYDGKLPRGRKLSPLHRHTFDMEFPNYITQVESMMNCIKANGWQWASEPR